MYRGQLLDGQLLDAQAQIALTLPFPLIKSQGLAAWGILPQCFPLLICYLE